jgi:hypothetical protein
MEGHVTREGVGAPGLEPFDNDAHIIHDNFRENKTRGARFEV